MFISLYVYILLVAYACFYLIFISDKKIVLERNKFEGFLELKLIHKAAEATHNINSLFDPGTINMHMV